MNKKISIVRPGPTPQKIKLHISNTQFQVNPPNFPNNKRISNMDNSQYKAPRPAKQTRKESTNELFMINLRKTYAYGDQTYRDHGFGCLYRCVQTLRHHYRLPFISVGKMIATIHGKNDFDVIRDMKRGDMKSLWIEPSDCKTLLKQKNVCLFIYTWSFSSARRLLQQKPQRASVTSYDEIITNAEWLRSVISVSLAEGHPLIVDNKTCAYVLHGLHEDPKADGGYIVQLADPHMPAATGGCTPNIMSFGAFCKHQWMIATCCTRC